MRLPALLACLALCSPAFGQTKAPPLAETRGTWLTTTANDAISTPAKTAETMSTLRELGLNTVYVECWKNGYTEFPSKTMDTLIGVPMKVNAAPADLQRDLLQEAVIEAHRNGLVAIGWFEYGFMAAHKDTHNELRKVAKERGWLTTTRAGEEVGKQNPFVWMNPLHPGPQELLLNIVLEAVDAYDLDGVQLDDRIAMPVEMGYDPYTKELYAKEHGGKMPPEDASDPQWIRWRAGKITQYAERFARQLKAARPSLLVSVSPAPHPWSLANYCCDWPAWQGQAWDEFVPQTYRPSFESFKATWTEQAVRMQPERRGDLIAGVMINGSSKVVSPLGLTASLLDYEQKREKAGEADRAAALAADLKLFLDEARDARFADVAKEMTLAGKYGGGYCLWFSRGVLDVYAKEFAEYLSKAGAAHNPRFPADWRPMPVVATRDGDNWKATITRPGTYRALAKFDGRWKVGEANAYEAGTINVDAAGAEAVEFLIDRRPEMNAASDKPRHDVP